LYIVYVINFKFTDIYLNITQSLHMVLMAIFPGDMKTLKLNKHEAMVHSKRRILSRKRGDFTDDNDH